MTRPTLGQLAYELSTANHHVHRGSFYRHQPSGKVYEVLGHSIREDDGAVLVRYRPVNLALPIIRFGEAPLDDLEFSRPMTEFIESTEWHDGESKCAGLRFCEVTRSPEWVNV